jgi:hypothetical protein
MQTSHQERWVARRTARAIATSRIGEGSRSAYTPTAGRQPVDHVSRGDAQLRHHTQVDSKCGSAVLQARTF